MYLNIILKLYFTVTYNHVIVMIFLVFIINVVSVHWYCINGLALLRPPFYAINKKVVPK